MSENSIHIGIDRRVARTRGLLADALMSLGAARGVEGLEVSDLVAEAGIARSTFYAHFSSRDDFLIRSFVNMLAATDAAYRKAYPDRPQVLPSMPLFQHVYQARDFALRMAQSEIYPHQMAAGEAKLREIAEANLAQLKPEWDANRRREAAIYIAGGFIGLLRWWKQTGLQQSPDQMQSAFERITNSVLEGQSHLRRARRRTRTRCGKMGIAFDLSPTWTRIFPAISTKALESILQRQGHEILHSSLRTESSWPAV